MNLSRLARSFRVGLWVCALALIVPMGASAYAAGPGIAGEQQQTIQMTGTVVEEDGMPLIGVSVFVENTTMGTTTGADGRFTLRVTAGATVTFSFLGYETVTRIASATPVTITLKNSGIQLEEVVAIGYGTQRRVTVTGAVSAIQTEDLLQSSSANLAGALAGRLPGLTAMQTSGQPGRDNVKLYLRGAGTTNDASPLILIDGVPRDNMSTMDPSEIASVSILKDASATAVFGVRGANGVILITTRRGTAGKTELSVSADFSMQSFIAKTDRLHSVEFAELRNQAERNSGKTENELTFTPYMIEKYRSGEDPVFYPDRDTYKETFRQWAPQTRVNVNLSGGGEKVQYFINIGYLNQGGNFKTESKSKLGYDPQFKLDRYNFRTNLDYKIAGSLKAFLNLGSYIEKMNTPAIVDHSGYDHLVTDLVQLTWRTPPTDPGPLTVAGHGVPEGQPVVNNGAAIGWINRSGYRRETRTNLNASFGLDWGLDFITKGLSTKFMISYDNHANSTLQAARRYDEYIAYVARNANETSRYTIKKNNQDDAVKLDKSYSSNYYINLQYSVNYARSFGKHDVTAMALLQRDNWEKDKADVPYNMFGVSARATYAYDYRYLAEVNMGYNGSEQFSPDNRFGFFPAFSVGWVASNEQFLKDNKVLTYLKFRASYGEVGNDKLGEDRFLYQSDIAEAAGWIPSLGRGKQIVQGRLGNPDITWEIAKKQNYGVDLNLFRDLSFSFDYFVEKRSDILIQRGTVPALQGVNLGNLPRVNMGKVKNRGYEMELAYNKSITKDLFVMVKGNFGYNKNTQEFMDEAILPKEYQYRYRKNGYSIGQNWGYLRDFSNGGNGYINSQEELDKLPEYQIGNPRIGDFKYLDLNGDGFINDKDKAPIGYSDIPRVVYGFSVALEYKGFDFSALFQGIGKVSRFYTDQGVIESTYDGYYTGYHRSAWTAERYANGEKILYPALSTAKNSNHLENDFFIMDRSFLRLKNAEIGYTLPEKTLKSIGISRLRVYVSGQNLLTWDKLLVNSIDPEQAAAMSYPLTRMFSFGVNVAF